jgi:hypothetical protein
MDANEFDKELLAELLLEGWLRAAYNDNDGLTVSYKAHGQSNFLDVDVPIPSTVGEALAAALPKLHGEKVPEGVEILQVKDFAAGVYTDDDGYGRYVWDGRMFGKFLPSNFDPRGFCEVVWFNR